MSVNVKKIIVSVFTLHSYIRTHNINNDGNVFRLHEYVRTVGIERENNGVKRKFERMRD